jgi:arylsulfatase A
MDGTIAALVEAAHRKSVSIPAMISMLALMACVALATPAVAPPLAPPNVVVVIMDDMGYSDVGCYGAPDAKTPAIDRIAREGIRLTDFYSNGPNCSPTRAAFISGRYQQRCGIEMPLGTYPADSARGLLPAPTSLPRLMKERGYATALIGKWHLGWKDEFHPNAQGFDEFWGFLGGWHDFYSSVDRAGHPDILHNADSSGYSGYMTDEISRRARAFIESHTGTPFFVEVAYNAPHWPFQGPDLKPDRRPRPDLLHDGTRAEYVAMLERADRGIGEILATLDRLGLARNTLVIFTSDNGGEWLSRNAPFFNRKSTLWEGGIRVPLVMRWPGRLPAGGVSAQVGITMDLTASILAAAGVRPPSSPPQEGMDLVPLLAGKRTVQRTLFWRIQSVARNQRAVRRGQWKYMRDGIGRNDGVHEFIFDLAKDPGERSDVTLAHADLLPEFRKLLDDWEADVDSSRVAGERRP